MSTVILVTGPDLDSGAADFVRQKGFDTVHTPSYADASFIARLLNETGAVGVVSRMGRLDAEVLDGATNLKVISKHGVGVDNIDLEAAARNGIPVLVASGANAVSVAEHAIALLMATVKRIVPLDAGLRAGRWEKPGFVGREIAGATIGFVGMGAIAQATAKIAAGLGLHLIGFDPFASAQAFADAGVTSFQTLDPMLAQADIVSLHCPLTPGTKGMLNADRFARMKRGSYVINTARGGLIDEPALLAAIRSGQLAGAGLDTFAVEPPAPEHPFWREPAIVVTPHIGGVTRQAGARVGLDAVRGIFQVLEGAAIAPERVANRMLLDSTNLYFQSK